MSGWPRALSMDYTDWIKKIASLCCPDRVHVCDGSEEEYSTIATEMVAKGTLVPLKRPRSFWCRSHPDDVARVEECTFICSRRQEDAGPTNHWMDPSQMHLRLEQLFEGSMKGRTLYVVPYCMGPFDSPYSKMGFEITDSPYVVLSMKLMTRMGREALNRFRGDEIPGIHSVGRPLQPQEQDVPWPCHPQKRVIAHFPEERTIWSYGSGYGGNALLGKKCLALRIASVLGKDQGWLAEHMLILGVTSPLGEKKYIAAAFPSSCGKTNLAMLTPSLPGWKVECVGDDIAWMRFGSDGTLYAINPEAGYFGVAPGTSMKTNPNAMKTISHDAIFTNVALTPDKDVWWEGMGIEPPSGLISWLGEIWDPQGGKPAAHPNSRFTVSSKQCPIYDPKADDPKGVPISAILFGGRRDSVVPLVYESFSWQHGVFLGASIRSQMTAAAKGEVGKLRNDPFSMLPFCGYNMGDYFNHWLEMGKKSSLAPPIYHVNWFLKDSQGDYLWPGYGENCRILKWIFERTSHQTPARKTAIGYIPVDLDATGLNVDLHALFKIDRAGWLREVDDLALYFKLFGDRMPQPLWEELIQFKKRLLAEVDD